MTIAHKTVSAEAPQPAVGKIDWAPGSKALLCIRPHAMRIVSLGERDALRATVIAVGMARRHHPAGAVGRRPARSAHRHRRAGQCADRDRQRGRVSACPNRRACWFAARRDRGSRPARRPMRPATAAPRRIQGGAVDRAPAAGRAGRGGSTRLLRVCLESTKAGGQCSRGGRSVLASQMFRDALWRTVAIAVDVDGGLLWCSARSWRSCSPSCRFPARGWSAG